MFFPYGCSCGFVLVSTCRCCAVFKNVGHSFLWQPLTTSMLAESVKALEAKFPLQEFYLTLNTK